MSKKYESCFSVFYSECRIYSRFASKIKCFSCNYNAFKRFSKASRSPGAVLRFGSVYIELRFFLLCNTEIQTLVKKVCCTDTIRNLLLQQRVYLQQQALSSRQIFNYHCVVHITVQRAIHIYDAREWDAYKTKFCLKVLPIFATDVYVFSFNVCYAKPLFR